jgi:hypothetical protein
MDGWAGAPLLKLHLVRECQTWGETGETGTPKLCVIVSIRSATAVRFAPGRRAVEDARRPSRAPIQRSNVRSNGLLMDAGRLSGLTATRDQQPGTAMILDGGPIRDSRGANPGQPGGQSGTAISDPAQRSGTAMIRALVQVVNGQAQYLHLTWDQVNRAHGWRWGGGLPMDKGKYGCHGSPSSRSRADPEGPEPWKTVHENNGLSTDLGAPMDVTLRSRNRGLDVLDCPVDCRNDGTPVTIDAGFAWADRANHVGYERLVRGICSEYRARAGN